jgi:DNA-binding Xre family transcriptional regulator
MKNYHNIKKRGGTRVEPVDLKEQILSEFREGDDHELSLFADSFFSPLYPPVVWDSDQELYVINEDLASLEPHTLYGVEELNRRIRKEMANLFYGYESSTGGKRKTKRKNNKKSKKTKRKVPLRYLPKRLSKKDTVKQRRELSKSIKAYKKGKYYTRKKVSSFKTKTSDHILKARKIYKLDKITPSKELSKKTGCSIASLQKMVKKGQGAYFSSGSRPNQTATSWGIARMASDVTGGKAAAVDFNILDEGCDHSKKAYKLAVQARKKHKFGKRKVPKASD